MAVDLIAWSRVGSECSRVDFVERADAYTITQVDLLDKGFWITLSRIVPFKECTWSLQWRHVWCDAVHDVAAGALKP